MSCKLSAFRTKFACVRLCPQYYGSIVGLLYVYVSRFYVYVGRFYVYVGRFYVYVGRFYVYLGLV